MHANSHGGRRIEDESGWLHYHSVGLFPGQHEAMSKALAEFNDSWLSLKDNRWAVSEAKRQRAIELWSAIAGGNRRSVFTVENVTQAFGVFINSLPADTLPGRKVLIAFDCFPSLHYLMSELSKRIGFELKTVAMAPGSHYVTDDDFIADWDESIALAMVNWVSSVSSHRTDITRMMHHAKRMGSIVALDVTQGIGIVPINLSELQVDFAAATSLKWLCGVPGTGFAYVDPDLLGRLNPRIHGWQSQPDPRCWDLDKFTLASGAGRFSNGTVSILPYVASLPGLEWAAAQGIANMAAYNRALCHRLIEIADRYGMVIASPRDDMQRGGSIMLDMRNSAAADYVKQRLQQYGFHCDARSQRLRWSPGAVTTAEALDVLDEAVGAILIESDVASPAFA